MNRYKPRYKLSLRFLKKINNKSNYEKLKKKKWYFFNKKYKFEKLRENEIGLLKIKKIKLPKKLKLLFKEELLVKQQLKLFYGNLDQCYIKNLFKKNVKSIEYLIILLESRLDIVLFRLNIFNSIFNVKQLIMHKKVKINNQHNNFRNYILNSGDEIEIDISTLENIQKNDNSIELKGLNYINIKKDVNVIKFFFVRSPFFNEILYPFPINLKLLKIKKKFL